MAAWNKGKSKVWEWIYSQVEHSGDDCLIFPFSRDPRGYGVVCNGLSGAEKKFLRAHRVMCFLAHGEAPTPKHQAAHSCGKGHTGCVNPRHLSWKTGSENQLDRRRHGTHTPGKGMGMGKKLNDDQVREIRSLRGKITQRRLAEQYKVSDATIRSVQVGRVYQKVASSSGRGG